MTFKTVRTVLSSLTTNEGKLTIPRSKSLLSSDQILNLREPIILLKFNIALIYGLRYMWLESFPIFFAGVYQFILNEGLAFIDVLIAAQSEMGFNT